MAERRPCAGMRTKRLLDILFASCGLVAAAPLMAIILLAIRFTMGKPVLFRQERPGLRARPFELVKFRTMRDETDEHGQPLPGKMRVTRLGYLLRKTSLDELPSLWNILKGEMSVVGPRPLLMEYLPRYTPAQARRHEVRPGLTGLAQISGRHLLDWETRFALDVWYVDHQSIRLDARIMIATIDRVLSGEGLPPPTADDTYFLGSEQSPS